MSVDLLHRFARASRTALAAVVLVTANAVCYAQSCALCYTQAAGAGHRFIQGLRTGILVLIVPPMFMSIGITWLAYRKRNRTGTQMNSAETDNNGW